MPRKLICLLLLLLFLLAGCRPAGDAATAAAEKTPPAWTVAYPATGFSYRLGMPQAAFQALQDSAPQEYLQTSSGISFYSDQLSAFRWMVMPGWTLNGEIDETFTADDMRARYGEPLAETEYPGMPGTVDYFYYLDGEETPVSDRADAALSVQFGFLEGKLSVVVAKFIPAERDLPKLVHTDGRTIEWLTPLHEIIEILEEEPDQSSSGVFFQYRYRFPDAGLELTATGPVMQSVLTMEDSGWRWIDGEGNPITTPTAFDHTGKPVDEADAYLRLSFVGGLSTGWRFDNQASFVL